DSRTAAPRFSAGQPPGARRAAGTRARRIDPPEPLRHLGPAVTGTSQRTDGRGRSAVALATLDAAPRARLAPLADRSRARRQVARAARLRAPAPPRRLADPPGHVLERAR